MSAAVSLALAEILRSHRDTFNARFTAARRQWPQLDAADFSLFLRDQLAPFVTALDASAPDRAALTTRVAYDLGLQLVAEKLAGPAARDSSINHLWQHLFPALAPLIATDPHRILTSLCNAAHQLATTPLADLDAWSARLDTLGPRCTDAAQLLLVAQLLAWRSGLAHYRSSALTAASSLPPPLALAALDAPAHSSWPEVQSAHLRDPWHGYATNGRLLNIPAAPRRIGAFRGFGGLFLAPPTVATSGDRLLVRSGDDAWLFIADAFGATFHRATPAELTSSSPSALSATPSSLTSSQTRELAAHLPAGHTLTSTAILGTTFALTSAQSHTLWLGRLAPR